MSKFTALDEPLYRYLEAHRTPDDDLMRELRAETEALGRPSNMQITADQGTLLTLLAALIGARFAIEVGTFTGFSAICIARGLAPGGRLLTCDVSDEWTRVARRYWARAGVAERIELRLGPALDTLRALPRESLCDFAFIDADKTGYAAYYEEILARLRPNGLIAVDNVLWDGRVLREADQEPDTLALRRFNEQVAADRRVQSVMLAVADGLTLARKL
jgi:caffeoyl-CoA O-methyltransferase